MSEFPSDLRYTSSHEWVRENDDGTIMVGITDHAQSALGDLVFVELPDAGSEIEAGESCIVVESVKAASDVYSPVGGEVVEVNEALLDAPELVNSAPFSEGWLMKLRPNNADELDNLLDVEAYQATLDDE